LTCIRANTSATGDKWHAEQADQLRRYVIELKEWIFKMEGR
jgi:hypothetical protein